jgi:hypothetical protein
MGMGLVTGNHRVVAAQRKLVFLVMSSTVASRTNCVYQFLIFGRLKRNGLGAGAGASASGRAIAESKI